MTLVNRPAGRRYGPVSHNLVMGRSANELILDETKKQTETQRQMAGELKQINEKLTPRPGNASPAAPVPLVDTVARFG